MDSYCRGHISLVWNHSARLFYILVAAVEVVVEGISYLLQIDMVVYRNQQNHLYKEEVDSCYL